MPQTRTPSCCDVVLAHFFRWETIFFSLASTPYCLVPIFRSRTQGLPMPVVKSSKRMYSTILWPGVLDCASLGFRGSWSSTTTSFSIASFVVVPPYSSWYTASPISLPLSFTHITVLQLFTSSPLGWICYNILFFHIHHCNGRTRLCSLRQGQCPCL